MENLRYDITLSDGRHVKAKPANVELVARYESSQVAGSVAQMERIRAANGLRDRLTAVEDFDLPVPLLLAATALEEYATKWPKSVVIGRSNAANPKGAQVLAKEVGNSRRDLRAFEDVLEGVSEYKVQCQFMLLRFEISMDLRGGRGHQDPCERALGLHLDAS